MSANKKRNQVYQNFHVSIKVHSGQRCHAKQFNIKLAREQNLRSGTTAANL